MGLNMKKKTLFKLKYDNIKMKHVYVSLSISLLLSYDISNIRNVLVLGGVT